MKRTTIVCTLAALLLPVLPLQAGQQADYPLKANPVGADRIFITDSEAGWVSKNIAFSLFAPANNPTFTGLITVPPFTGTTYAGTSLLAAVQAALTAMDGASEISATPFIVSLFDDPDAATARATLEIPDPPTVTISTSQPTGGVNGDIWYVTQ